MNNIRSSFEKMITSELLKIWEKYDIETYTEEYFKVLSQVLKERGEQVEYIEADNNLENPYIKSTDNRRINYAPKAEKYPALNSIARYYNALANLSIIVAFLGVIGGVTAIRNSFPLGLGITICSLFTGATMYVNLRAISEGIIIFIDIERNTRITSNLLSNK